MVDLPAVWAGAALRPSNVPRTMDKHRASRALLIEPDGGEILPEVVARRHVPALDLLVVYDDTLPPQDRHIISLDKRVALHLPDDLGALSRIDGAALFGVHIIDFGVGVARVAAG